jgi:hypothetical protein
MSDWVYENMGKLLLATFAFIIVLLVYVLQQEAKQTQSDLQKTYAVFIRQTGNSNNVTFEEFSAMMRVQHPQPSSTVTPIPIIIPIR